HHAAVQGDIAVQHGQTTFLGVGVRHGADAAFGAVQVEARPAGVLAERGLGRDAGRTGLEELVHGRIIGLGDVPLGDGFGHARAVHGRHVGVQQAAAGQFTEDGEDAAGAVHVFHVVLLDVRRHLAQLRYFARQPVDVAQVEGQLGLLGGGQQVQDGVGRAAHGDVQGHGVLEGLEAGDVARQDVLVAFVVVLPAQVDDQPAGAQEQLFAVAVGGQGRTVARQREAEGLGQAVHRVGGEHAGAAAAGRAGAALVLGDLLIGAGVVGRDYHGVDQVEAVAGQLG